MLNQYTSEYDFCPKTLRYNDRDVEDMNMRINYVDANGNAEDELTNSAFDADEEFCNWLPDDYHFYFSSSSTAVIPLGTLLTLTVEKIKNPPYQNILKGAISVDAGHDLDGAGYSRIEEMWQLKVEKRLENVFDE